MKSLWCPLSSSIKLPTLSTQDDRWKFAFGCIGVAGIGLAAEALIWFRRRLQQQKEGKGQRRRKNSRLLDILVESALYCGSILLGYAAMLVAMTYSVELFACVCAGLVIGHAAFNSSAPVGETADPCCAATQNQVRETTIWTIQNSCQGFFKP